MKSLLRIVIVTSLVVFAAPTGSTGSPYPRTYVGVFADEDRNCSVEIYAPYITFEAWVWVLPNYNGMICADFGVFIPGFTIIISSIVNPETVGILPACTDPQDCSLCFSQCHGEWTWLYRYTVLPFTTQVGMISVGDPLSGTLAAYDCSPGNPSVKMIVFSNLQINMPCIISSEDQSWGAIKSLYLE